MLQPLGIALLLTTLRSVSTECEAPPSAPPASEESNWTWIIVLASIGAVALLIAVYLGYRVCELYTRPRIAHACFLMRDSGDPPQFFLPPGCEYHLFLSHCWQSGQDQAAVIKRQMTALLPGPASEPLRVFLDVDDLVEIDSLETYVQQSAVILLFLSRGYFLSTNCLREVRAAIASNKPLVLVHETKAAKGGAPLDELMIECPADLRERIFGGATPAAILELDTLDTALISWHRMRDYQRLALLRIAQRILVACAAEEHWSLPGIGGKVSLLDAFFAPQPASERARASDRATAPASERESSAQAQPCERQTHNSHRSNRESSESAQTAGGRRTSVCTLFRESAAMASGRVPRTVEVACRQGKQSKLSSQQPAPQSPLPQEQQQEARQQQPLQPRLQLDPLLIEVDVSRHKEALLSPNDCSPSAAAGAAPAAAALPPTAAPAAVSDAPRLMAEGAPAPSSEPPATEEAGLIGGLHSLGHSFGDSIRNLLSPRPAAAPLPAAVAAAGGSTEMAHGSPPPSPPHKDAPIHAPGRAVPMAPSAAAAPSGISSRRSRSRGREGHSADASGRTSGGASGGASGRASDAEALRGASTSFGEPSGSAGHTAASKGGQLADGSKERRKKRRASVASAVRASLGRAGSVAQAAQQQAVHALRQTAIKSNMLYDPIAITEQPLTLFTHVLLFVSKHNPGALEVAGDFDPRAPPEYPLCTPKAPLRTPDHRWPKTSRPFSTRCTRRRPSGQRRSGWTRPRAAGSARRTTCRWVPMTARRPSRA